MKEKKLLQCNICGYPDEIKYKEEDENGRIVWVTQKVKCLGHQVHPSLWNMHPLYDQFRKYRVRQQNPIKKD